MISTADSATTGACPYCGWPDRAEPFKVVSRHSTAAGRTVWTRCGCGSLQVRVVSESGLRVVSRSRPPEQNTDRTAVSSAGETDSGRPRLPKRTAA